MYLGHLDIRYQFGINFNLISCHTFVSKKAHCNLAIIKGHHHVFFSECSKTTFLLRRIENRTKIVRAIIPSPCQIWSIRIWCKSWSIGKKRSRISAQRLAFQAPKARPWFRGPQDSITIIVIMIKKSKVSVRDSCRKLNLRLQVSTIWFLWQSFLLSFPRGHSVEI